MAANAIQFDGSTQYGTALNYSAIDSLTSYTLEGWFYQHDASNTYALAASIANTTPIDFFELQRDTVGSTAVNFTSRFATQNADGYSSSNCFPTDTWQYVAMVLDVSGDKKTHIYYGATPTEVSYALQNTGSGTQQSASGMNFYMAYDPNDSGSGKWLGNIGGFLRLWNVARTTTQLAANYNLGLQSANETGLIGNWKFSEGSGTSIANNYSAGNAISLTGSPSWVTGPTITEKSYGVGNFFAFFRP